MKDDPAFNIKFVTTLERYPCLYNSEHVNYNNKEAWNAAWTNVAEEVGESDVEECKARWKNIRGCLTRYMRLREKCLKTGRRPIKKYYLYDCLKFVVPYTKRRVKLNDEAADSSLFDYSAALMDLEEFEEELLVEDDPLSEENQEHYSINEPSRKKMKLELTESNLEYENGEYNQNKEKESQDVQPSREKRRTKDTFTLREQKRHYEKYCSPEDYWQLEVESPSTSSSNMLNPVGNSDLDFFKSILDDIAQFSPKKKRQFKQRVLKLIDELSEEQ